MSNTILNAVSLDDPSGICSNHSHALVIGVALRSALSGVLTLNGVTNADGSPAAWTVSSGASGFSAPPGTKQFWGAMSFSYANPADAGKAVLIFQPL